jgi:hypothetical protein
MPLHSRHIILILSRPVFAPTRATNTNISWRLVLCQVKTELERWFGLWCFTSLSTQYFSYVMVVSFIGGGNRRKPEQDSNSQRDDNDDVLFVLTRLAES